MKELIEAIVKELVDKPDEVSVTPVESERTVIYELRVGDGDLGKVIGKQGRTAQAIRTIVSAVSAKGGGRRALLEIIE
ncbi:MAG: KH domain-containing protein [Fidelibacterota bacterium]